jgi:N-methylhydantoinase A/oxoprolinase/acetone carboxylase beta subunit
VPVATETLSASLAIDRADGGDEPSIAPSADASSADASSAGALAARFAARYRELYGYLPAAREAELVALRVAAAGPGGLPEPWLATEETEATEVTNVAGRERGRAADSVPAGAAGSARGAAAARRLAWFGRWRRVPVHERAGLVAGARLRGPALVVEAHTTSVVAAGWSATIDAAGALVLRRVGRRRAASDGGRAR